MIFSKSEVANELGVSLPAISNALSRGSLFSLPDGKIDLADPRNERYLTRAAHQRRDGQRTKLRNARKQAAAEPAAPTKDDAPFADFAQVLQAAERAKSANTRTDDQLVESALAALPEETGQESEADTIPLTSRQGQAVAEEYAAALLRILTAVPPGLNWPDTPKETAAESLERFFKEFLPPFLDRAFALAVQSAEPDPSDEPHLVGLKAIAEEFEDILEPCMFCWVAVHRWVLPRVPEIDPSLIGWVLAEFFRQFFGWYRIELEEANHAAA